jgi:type II secretion system protein I
VTGFSKIKSRKSKILRGFTLVEMVVATVLLALGVVGALACISSATRSTSISSEYTTAALLAQQKLAELEAQPDQIQGGEQSGDFGEEHPTFSWRQQVDSTSITSLMRVTLHIEWKSGSLPRSAQFASYVLLPVEEQQ